MNSGLTLFDEETKGSKAGKIFLALISLESTNEEFKWLNTATAEGSDKSSIGKKTFWKEAIEPFSLLNKSLFCLRNFSV